MKTETIEFIPKVWGYEKVIWNDSSYCGKLLFIAKGHQCSWHYHKIKKETFYVQSGKVVIFYGELDDLYHAEEVVLSKGDGFHIPTGLRHRILALEDSELFEFSTQHFDEDSIRLEVGG